jgi:hypothetical protein
VRRARKDLHEPCASPRKIEVAKGEARPERRARGRRDNARLTTVVGATRASAGNPAFSDGSETGGFASPPHDGFALDHFGCVRVLTLRHVCSRQFHLHRPPSKALICVQRKCLDHATHAFCDTGEVPGTLGKTRRTRAPRGQEKVVRWLTKSAYPAALRIARRVTGAYRRAARAVKFRVPAGPAAMRR